MKKLFHFGLLFFTIITQAQTSVYHPFPDSNASWCCEKGYSTGCCLCGFADYEYHATYLLDGQIFINGLTYNRLLHYENLFDRCSPDTTVDTITFFIRQDTSLKLIWLYDFISNSDIVLYDFNLQIGDTLFASKVFWARNIQPPDYWIVSSIDSISINGQYRKQYNYYPTYSATCTSSMIEGIGSIHGLMYEPSNCFEYGATLRKFFLNNQLQYGDSSPTWFACHDFTLSINETDNRLSAKIFPNPFHENAMLQLNEEFKNVELKIYNSIGQQVRHQSNINKYIIINRNNLPNGIYFYQVSNKNGQIFVGKFLIE